jgi:hypothetical protein
MAGAIGIIGIDRLDARLSDCSSCSLRCEGGECFNLREFGPPLLNEQARLDNQGPGRSFLRACKAGRLIRAARRFVLRDQRVSA